MLFPIKWMKPLKRGSSMAMLGIAMMMILSMLVPQPAYAAGPSISIQSEAGFGGKMKMNEWGPLTITLTSDKDISGELVVQSKSSYYGTSVSYVKQVDLPAGTTKKVTLGILGNDFDKTNNEIRFYEGSAESGKYIPFSSGKPYLQNSTVRGTLIGVLAADPDSMNFLAAQSGAGNNVTLIPLKGEQIYEDSNLLSTLDVLVMNNFPADTLTSKQMDGIRTWVKQGGSLVLSGGQGYTKSAQGLEDLSPVEFRGGADVSALPELVQIGGKPLSFSEPFPLSNATLKEDADLEIGSRNLPLFASRPSGQGKVYYAAYDMAMEPLHSWGGHAEVWNRVLDQEVSLTSGTMNLDISGNNILQGASYLLNYFPSLTLPPFSLLLWLLIGYAVVVAPILYYVLKRADKREWAWGLIPLIAVIASGGIYMAGSAGKSSVKTHTLSVVEMDGRGEAVRQTASAVFVPRGGNYNLSFPAGTYMSVSREDGLLTGGQNSTANRQIIRVKDEATEVKLKDMTHRSIAQLFLNKSKSMESGAMQIDVSYDEQGHAQGTVTNGTKSNLSSAALIIAGEVYMLGDLSQGATVQIPAASASVSYYDYGSMIFPHASGNRTDEMILERQRGMINQYMNQSINLNKHVFIAWNEEELSGYQVNGHDPSSEQLNMWTQSFVPGFEQDGKIAIPFGLIEGKISSTTSNQWATEGAGRINMSAGEMRLEYSLPKLEGAAYSQLELRSTFPGEHTTYMIWNAIRQEWENLDSNNKISAEFKENTGAYLENGYVKIKITADDWTTFDLPDISLKGEVSR